MQKIGMIAGYGEHPIIFAKNARLNDVEVVAIALKEQTSPLLAEHVDTIHWISIGQLGRLIKLFKKEKITRAVMVGKIKKTLMFSNIRMDIKGISLWSRLSNRGDDAILRAVAEELENEGIILEDNTPFIVPLLSESGLMTKRHLTSREKEDVMFGWKLAKEIGNLDIGQCVVVKDLTVLAIEAIEGTDQAILRGGQLGGRGVLVIKVSKPNQDMRFDVPVVGAQTIRTMQQVGASVLVVETGRTLMFEREEMIRLANEANISILGTTNGKLS
ncbi:MAG: UDP-2,3-diacylglucosamine diphosphatase LpxI [Deltaproteobacteria bacterium]|nr:UDP-2,3-diacylglucosamine diphosphatase LpxI [Deltaproteobacteria bacterium]